MSLTRRRIGVDWGHVARGVRGAYGAYQRNRPALRQAWDLGSRAVARVAVARKRSSTGARAKPRAKRTRTRGNRRPTGRGRRLPPGSRSIRSKSRAPVSGAGKAVSLRAVTDMLFPLLKVDHEVALTNMEWDANEQGLETVQVLTNADLDQLHTKVSSSDVMGFLGGNADSVRTSQAMQYNGGYVEYTLLNICNHTVEVLVYDLVPKRRHGISVLTCWDKDLLNDDTQANLVVPIDVPAIRRDYGVDLFEKSNPMSYMNHNWRKRRMVRRVMAVGETFTHRVPLKAFVYDKGRENMFQSASGESIPFTFGPAHVSTQFICRSQIVANDEGNKIAHGSGKVSIAGKTTHYVRGHYKHKRFQQVSWGGLDEIDAADQVHYNVDTEAINHFDEADAPP